VNAFDDATAVVAAGPSVFDWAVPDGWQQGRGAWGGLVVGALVRAIAPREPDGGRTVRSVSVHMSMPALVGTHRIETRLVRRGSATSTWSAVVTDPAGATVAGMTAVLGSPRVADARLDHASWGTTRMPQAPPVDRVTELPIGPPLMPVFGQHFRAHPVAGLPLTGGAAECLGWIGYAAPTPWTAGSMLALVDAWWPASLVALTGMQRVATVAFSANLLFDPAAVPVGEVLLHHSFVTAAHEGFTSEQRRLWTADGRLVVDNLQSIVVGS
jgi:hypothetical protein